MIGVQGSARQRAAMQTPNRVISEYINRDAMSRASGTRGGTRASRTAIGTRKYRNGRRIKGKNSTHPVGELHPNTILSRLPNGMPISSRPNVPNYLLGHRLGSRIRTREQRFLQQGRQLARINPSRAALRLAPSRLFNANDPGNVSKSTMGWSEGENIVHMPLKGYFGSVGVPITEATELRSRRAHRQLGTESDLYLPWMQTVSRVRRPMTPAELEKEERFRQRAAEQAQRRARELYISPRNITRTPRRVKSLSLKSKKKTKKHSI